MPDSGFILSLDPSPNFTGAVVLDIGNQLARLNEPRMIKTIDLSGKDWALTYKAIHAAGIIKALAKRESVEAIVCEKVSGVSFGRGNDFNTQAAMTKVEGMIQFIGHLASIPVRMFPPGQWKPYYRITGSGQKHQARVLAAELSTTHLSGWTEHAAEAYLIGRYYAEKFAMKELKQMRLL